MSFFVRFLHVLNVLKTSFVRSECFKDFFCTLLMSSFDQECLKSFVHYECLKEVFYKLWMSLRRLYYVMDVLKTSFVSYGFFFQLY